MVLTMLSNRARMKAAIAEAVAEGKAQGMVQGVVQGMAQGMAQGAHSQDQLWRDWNSRREAAAREGRNFTEAPPEPPAHTNNGGADSH